MFWGILTEKENKKSNKNLIIYVAVAVAFFVGLVGGIFVGPLILFHGHGRYLAGGFHGSQTNHTTNSSVHYNYSVDIATLPGIGQYLVNSTGWALYMYVPDVPNSGKSTCYGECAVAWPIFYTPNLTVEPGLNLSLFGTINRTDSTKEITYNGYPLYYYEYDTGAGNINGQDVGGIWYLLSPSGTIIKNTT